MSEFEEGKWKWTTWNCEKSARLYQKFPLWTLSSFQMEKILFRNFQVFLVTGLLSCSLQNKTQNSTFVPNKLRTENWAPNMQFSTLQVKRLLRHDVRKNFCCIYPREWWWNMFKVETIKRRKKSVKLERVEKCSKTRTRPFSSFKPSSWLSDSWSVELPMKIANVSLLRSTSSNVRSECSMWLPFTNTSEIFTPGRLRDLKITHRVNWELNSCDISDAT